MHAQPHRILSVSQTSSSQVSNDDWPLLTGGGVVSVLYLSLVEYVDGLSDDLYHESAVSRLGMVSKFYKCAHILHELPKDLHWS